MFFLPITAAIFAMPMARRVMVRERKPEQIELDNKKA